MFRRRSKPEWLVDPSKAVFGSVVDNIRRNLSRSHVRVKYHQQSEARFVPLATFMKRCNEVTRGGQSLDIEHLRVAPILKRRYTRFFDRLTDWGPATRRALSPRPRPQHPVLHDR
jgi:phage-related protein